MHLFRKAQKKSVRLWVALFLFWLILVSVLLIGLVWRFRGYSELLITIGDFFQALVWFPGVLLLATAAFIASVHYAILRFSRMRKLERVIVAGVILSAVGCGVVVVEKWRERIELHTVIWNISDSGEEFRSLYRAGKYDAVVSLMETRCVEYDEAVKRMGSINAEELQDLLGNRETPHYGTSRLFYDFIICGDYNARYLPNGVVSFLVTGTSDRVEQEPEWQSLARRMQESKEPMLQAYGLWLCGEYEIYRDYVYAKADAEDPSFYGFAAHATAYDRDDARALSVLLRYSKLKTMDRWETEGLARDACNRAISERTSAESE